MISRPDLRLIFAAAAMLALVPPVAAAPGADPLAEAASALDRGDAIAAEVAAKRALDSGRPREQVAAFAGEAKLLQADLVAARGWLAAGRFAAGSAQRGFHALARLEMADGNSAAAARAFDQALAQGRPTAPLWVDIGRFRYANGQHDLALAAAERAVQIDPADPRALQFRGQLARDASGVRAALPWFERALEKAPDDLGLLGEYAATLGEAGENRAMLRVARRMVELDPRHPRAFFLQAVLAARGGQYTLARRLLWRTGGAYDQTPAGRLLSGTLHLQSGNAALAVEELDELARLQPDNGRVMLLFGRALLASGEASELVARLGPAAARPDASPYLLTLVGRGYEQLGRREEAASLLDRAAASGGLAVGVLPVGAAGELAIWRAGGEFESAGAAVPLLRRMLAEGQGGAALALGRRLGERYRGSADVERLRGDIALLAGDPAAALAAYARAGRIRRDATLVERMAIALDRLDRQDAAVALLTDHVRKNPRDGRAVALLGRMQAALGRMDSAAALLGHALGLGSGSSDPALLADYAAVELAAADAKAAGTAARRAYALQRSNGRVSTVLAGTLQDSEPRKAEVLLAKVRQLAGGPQLARR